MHVKSIRVAVAAAALAVVMTACSSPMEAGSAAVVGNERISASDLTRNVQEYEAALRKAGVQPDQMGLPGSVPEVVLYQLANVKQAEQLVRKAGVRVSEGEVDQAIDAAQQQGATLDQNMLSRGMAPSLGRDYMRISVGIQKLLQQYGGGTDEAAQQRGNERLQKEAATISISFNPRYGKINQQRTEENQALFVDAGRFGKAAEPAQPQQQPQG